jgi:uncharacterized protein YvpB
MPRLDIPYRSQWAADADKYSADCGPTCVAMVLGYHNIHTTPNQIYAENFPHKEVDEYTNFNELIGVFRRHQVGVAYREAGNRAEALHHLRANIDVGKPIIALVHYRSWRAYGPIRANDFDGGHFVVVTGYDNEHIYMHDPLFGLWITPASTGAHFAMPIDVFCAGWSSFTPRTDGKGNPNWAYLIADGKGQPVQPTPGPVPAPPPPPSAPAAPPPPPAVTSGRLMEDVNRRIRALVAYRWAEAPNFHDETAVALWRDHLGDWGYTYQEHTVQAGESYTILAQRYFGQAHRWPAIRAYNTSNRESLWVGETILIPDLGQSGAHLNPALPSDTLSEVKSLDLDDLVDPEQSPMDYNALWDDSIYLGYVEEE